MTAIGDGIVVEREHGEWLEAFDEARRVVVEDDSLVEQVVGVEDVLEFLHHLIRFLSPFIFHERCHIATCSMLRLQRAVVFLYHEARHVSHHLFVAFHFAFALETLVEDEVIVAFEGVSVDAGVVVSMVGNEFLQLHRSLGKVVDVEGYVLDKA